MNKKKKLAVFLSVALSIGALGLNAYASSNDYTTYTFSFDLSGYGDSMWSSPAEKEDNENTAVVRTTGGYVDSTSFVYLSVYKQPSNLAANCLSESVKVTSPDERYEIPYTTIRGAGSINYLRANSGYYSAEITGRWNP